LKDKLRRVEGAVMENKDHENLKLQEQLQQKEAGVTELLELYSKVETAYASIVQALATNGTNTTTNTTNLEVI
jgi:hypothetical protein